MSFSDFSSHAVLVYGPRKSGTTLLNNLLDGGNNLLVLPGEIKLHLRRRAADQLAECYIREGRDELYRLIKSLSSSGTLEIDEGFYFKGLTHEQTCELFDLDTYIAQITRMWKEKPTDYATIVRRDVEAFARSMRQRREYSGWAAKEVGGAPDKINSFFGSQFPGAKFLFLARNPYFIVRSIILDRRRKNIHLRPREVWSECAKAQTITDFLWQRAHVANGKHPTLIINYEKLTSATENTMQRICDFLEIPLEPILLQPTILGKPVVVFTSSQKTTQVFQDSSTWKKGLTALQILTIKTFFSTAPRYYQRRGKLGVEYSALLERLGNT